MNKFDVFYGSTTRTTEDLAHRIAEELGIPSADIFDVSKLTKALVNEYDVLVLGSSTWGTGGLQDDRYDGVKVLKKYGLSRKSVALFGCGDSNSHNDIFCDATGILYEDLKDTHCKFCGTIDTAGYASDSSIVVVDGKFVGLPPDEVNKDSRADGRISAQAGQVKQEISQFYLNIKRILCIMAAERIIPGEVRILLNRVYEFKEDVRNMVLYTMSKEHGEFATRRLKNQKISYMIQEVGTDKISLLFGKTECMKAVRYIIIRPLNQLTTKEDLILGAMLGYDPCQQCRRYCSEREGIKMVV